VIDVGHRVDRKRQPRRFARFRVRILSDDADREFAGLCLCQREEDPIRARLPTSALSCLVCQESFDVLKFVLTEVGSPAPGHICEQLGLLCSQAVSRSLLISGPPRLAASPIWFASTIDYGETPVHQIPRALRNVGAWREGGHVPTEVPRPWLRRSVKGR
jgi:hypothetical protein